MSKKSLWVAVATLVGCVIGAGILSIPYVVSKSGLIPGLISILVIGLLFMLVNLYLGEVALRTKGNFYLMHYAQKYLDNIGKRLMALSLVIGIYGALIAYAFGLGSAMSSLTGMDSLLGGVLMFALLSWAVYCGIGAISYAEFIIMPFVISFTLLIFLFSLGKLDPVNLTTPIAASGFLHPFGVLLFAFMGTSAIPELKEQLDGDKKLLKKAIIIGSAIPIFVYSLFTFAIVGVLGSSTPEVATLGLEDKLGNIFKYIGGIFPLLTMSTSFMALGFALSRVFNTDYGLRKNTSWLLACFVPFMIFILLKMGNIGGFASIIDLTGVITGVIAICLIVIMAVRAKKMGERTPEYSIYINNTIAAIIIGTTLIGGLLQLGSYLI